MLNLPVYLRNGTYYFHVRIRGVQFKRSLKTGDKSAAIMLAARLLEYLKMATIRPLELNFGTHQFKADGPEELAELKEILRMTGYQAPSLAGHTSGAAPAVPAIPSSMTITALVDNFFLQLNTLSAATERDYRSTVKHFVSVVGDLPINTIDGDHITVFMDAMAKLKTTPRTTDKKVGAIRALLNYAITKQLRKVAGNPAADRNLLTKKQKNAGGQKPFEIDQLKLVFACPEFRELALTEPAFYLVMMLAISSGGRITALTQIKPPHLRRTELGQPYIYIAKDKTPAGTRNVPVPEDLFQRIQEYLEVHKTFGYVVRTDGKGTSDKIRKRMDKHMADIKFEGEKLSSHSIRKTLNDYLKKQKVPIEARCQFVGHDINDINETIYSTKYSIDELAEFVVPVESRLLKSLEFVT